MFTNTSNSGNSDKSNDNYKYLDEAKYSIVKKKSLENNKYSNGIKLPRYGKQYLCFQSYGITVH